jgi:predicted HTH transcriptional regulator
MSSPRNEAYLVGLVQEFCKLPAETGWVEFKVNNCDPQEVGEYISALSNAAALAGKGHGYVVWGIDNETHEIVGTAFQAEGAKKGNEDLESWLLRLLNPKLHFHFYSFLVGDKKIVMLEIPAASGKPTSFSNVEYTRIGTYKKPLKDFAEQERELWRAFDKTPFESLTAKGTLTAAEVLDLLDYPAYFSLLSLPLPTDQEGILKSLESDRMLQANDAGYWDITNLVSAADVN